MSVLTWRNVNAPQNYAANQLLTTGARTLTGALDEADQLMRDRYKAAVDKNTSAYKDAAASYRTPEELQAAIAGGELDALKQSFGSRVNADALRGEAQRQLTSLREGQVADHAYGVTKAKQEFSPIQERITQLFAENRDAEALALQKQNSELAGRAGASQDLLNQNRGEVSYDRKVAQDGRDDAARLLSDRIDRITTGALGGKYRDDTLQANQLAELNKKFGIPATGADEYIASMSPIDRAAYQNGITGLAQNTKSATHYINDVGAQVAGLPGVSPQQLIQSTANVNSLVTPPVATSDQARFSNEISQIRDGVIGNDNPYLNTDVTESDVTDSIINNPALDGSDVTDASVVLKEMLSGKHKIEDSNGNLVSVELPKAFLVDAMKTYRSPNLFGVLSGAGADNGESIKAHIMAEAQARGLADQYLAYRGGSDEISRRNKEFVDRTGTYGDKTRSAIDALLGSVNSANVKQSDRDALQAEQAVKAAETARLAKMREDLLRQKTINYK